MSSSIRGSFSGSSQAGQDSLLLVIGRHSHLRIQTSREEEILLFVGVAQRKISKIDRQNIPEPLGLTGDKLLGLAMACSL
jgi:hypothetical protein